MQIKTLLAAAALLALPLSAAHAAPAGSPGGLLPAIGEIGQIESVQYIYGGRRHCWYPNGWHGPGWYWCGYAMRQGYGWGGGVGWNGWSYGAPRPVYRAYRGGPRGPYRAYRGPRRHY